MTLKDLTMYISTLSDAEKARAYLSILESWNLPDEGRTPRERGLIAAAYHWTHHPDVVAVSAAHEALEYIVERLNELGVMADNVALDLKDVGRFLPAHEGYDQEAVRIAVELLGLTRREGTTIWATGPVAVTRLAPVPTPRGRRRLA